jgi:phospholipid/cholesterol/gamma-HCH transport system ATP-binding protein
MTMPRAVQAERRLTPREAPAADPIIRLVGIQKSFGQQHVLRGIDLEVHTGRTLVIMGPSGCGKSVLLKHIVGLLRPDAGEIYFGDQRIDKLSERALKPVRKQMGLLFQMGALFDSMSVLDNVAFPLIEHTRDGPAKRKERVRAALATVDMAGYEDRLPAQLSGGQRKRVALARAIVLQPRVVLYDEPTTGLDPVRSDGINSLIIKLRDTLGITSIVVTHDLASARRVADRLVMILGGHIAADGTYRDLARSSDPRIQQFIVGHHDPGGMAEAKPDASRAAEHARSPDPVPHPTAHRTEEPA